MPGRDGARGMSNVRNPRRSPEASFRPFGKDGGLVVMPMRREVQVLNPVGIRVFSLLDGTRSEAEIVGVVLEEFEVSPEDAARDVAEFLEQLRGAGMLADDRDPVGEGIH